VACVLALQASAAAAQRLTLNVAQSSIVLPSADPDTTPSIVAPPLIVVVRVQQTGSEPWQLTVQANGDLVSGASTIDITNVTWTATGGGFAGGTMNKTTAQTVGSWGTSGTHSGTVTLALANSWAYNAGAYPATLTYTLTAP
jgi:hypothetical protein